jgi:hypothetical protein
MCGHRLQNLAGNAHVSRGTPLGASYLLAAARLEVLCDPTKGNPAPMTNVRLDMDREAGSWGRMKTSVVFAGGLLLALGGLVAACGSEGGDVTAAGTDWGPLAVTSADDGYDDAVTTGMVRMTSECVGLAGSDGFVLVAWPSERTDWIADDDAVSLYTRQGEEVLMHDGDLVTLSGAAGGVAESGRSLEELVDERAWLVEPSVDCVADEIWFAGDEAHLGVPEPGQGPIGGGLAAGWGADVTLECPPDIEVRETHWYGPVGHDEVAAAIDAGFGDLIVSSLGEPEPYASGGGWSTWTLERDRAVVAAVTAVLTPRGWDPSTGTWCDIRRPEPEPPPLTLHVSNQSFEDSSVHITVTLDGETVVDDSFDVRDQHHVVTFELDIGPGEHELVATSNTGVEHEAAFTTADGEPVWLALLYWYYPDDDTHPRQFTFGVSDEPIEFA